MPLFIDEHRGLHGISTAAMMDELARELDVQARFGVRFLGRWFDETTGVLVCLAEAPVRESVEAIHRATHGMVPDRVVAVGE